MEPKKEGSEHVACQKNSYANSAGRYCRRSADSHNNLDVSSRILSFAGGFNERGHNRSRRRGLFRCFYRREDNDQQSYALRYKRRRPCLFAPECNSGRSGGVYCPTQCATVIYSRTGRAGCLSCRGKGSESAESYCASSRIRNIHAGSLHADGGRSRSRARTDASASKGLASSRTRVWVWLRIWLRAGVRVPASRIRLCAGVWVCAKWIRVCRGI